MNRILSRPCLSSLDIGAGQVLGQVQRRVAYSAVQHRIGGKVAPWEARLGRALVMMRCAAREVLRASGGAPGRYHR